MWDHGDIKSLWSPSQELSNDVSYVGLSETFIIYTCLRVWGLRWYNFTWGCPIMVIFTIYDLQVKHLPMMYHMLIYLKFYNLYSIKDLRFEMVYLHIRMSDHGGFQNLRFPSQELSNDVSYVGLIETFIFSTGSRVWGLRWFNFAWGCRIMVIFRNCDLQVKSFPLMYHMLVHLIFLKTLHVQGWMFGIV